MGLRAGRSQFREKLAHMGGRTFKKKNRHMGDRSGTLPFAVANGRSKNKKRGGNETEFREIGCENSVHFQQKKFPYGVIRTGIRVGTVALDPAS